MDLREKKKLGVLVII